MMRLVVLVAVLAAGCGARGGERILVAAAADLAEAMPALADAFRDETGIVVETSLGSSGQIANQILNGAPIDVFASADRGWIDRLLEAGRLDDAAGAVLYAYGALVVVVPAGRRAPDDLSSLTDPSFGRIAIAHPEHAPYGVAAREALMRLELWDELQPRIVIAENVRQAHRFAATGSVDAALTARALVDAGADNWTPVASDLYSPLAQTVAAVRDRPAIAQARAFVAFMAGPAAREILGRHGFVLP